MAKATQKITLSPARDIPFDKLLLSQSNVRRVKSGISIEELAEDIARRGTLLQSLKVRPVLDADGNEAGMFEVPAGGRRYQALELLVQQKRFTKTSLVPCVMRDAATPILAEDDILLVWNRLIFPNGRAIVLERQPGADTEGDAGLEDGVDYHWGELFKAAALSTLLSIGSQAGSSSEESDIVRALRQGSSDSISQVGRQVVSRRLDIAPTLTIRPGFPVRVIVTRDLVLEPYGG